MSASKQLLRIATVFAVLGQRPLQAETPIDRVASTAADLVTQVRMLIREVARNDPAQEGGKQARPAPQAIPAGGPTVDLGNLSQPTLLENRLRTALQPSTGELRLTIPGG